tara:strand:+ start:1827 stop:2729 length:903 start_codon:yes stop_codon:yes gene_type:complete
LDTNLNTFLPQTEIAVIFDFDITLTPKYMQSIIFDRFNIDENNFWSETEDLKLQGYDSEHAYIKNLISYIRSGKINKLSNQDLIKLGSELEFHKGFPDILDRLKDIPDQTNEISPKVKFYVISSGFEDMIKGSKVYPKLKRLWGCTFDENEKGNIDFPKETISSTTKTQKLFLINKGLLKNEDSLSVNDFMPYESRPVPFKNMIYVGDGPTDVPCFSLLMQNGGQSVAVYEPKDKKAFDECYRLVVESKRADVMCPADYSEDSQLYLSLSKMIEKISDNINSDIENSKSKGLIKSPEHLN